MRNWKGSGALTISTEARLAPVTYELQEFDRPDRLGHMSGGFITIPQEGILFMMSVWSSRGKFILEMADGVAVKIKIDNWQPPATGIRFHVDGPLPP